MKISQNQDRKPLWNVRVVVCKFDLNVKQASFVDAALWAWHCGLPFEEVVLERTELDGPHILFLEVGNLAVDAFQSSLSTKVGLVAVAYTLRDSRKKLAGAAYFRVIEAEVVVG